MTIETLDDMLGDGAYEDFLAVLRLYPEEYQPTCYQNKVEVSGESWRPDDGVHIAVYLEWPDGLFQIISFKDDKGYLGNGLCLDESFSMVIETTLRMGSKMNVDPGSQPPFIEWAYIHGVTAWITSLPSDYHNIFTALGWDIGESNETGMAMASAETSLDSKTRQYQMWARAGMKPEDRPSWTMGHAFIDSLMEQNN